MTALWDASLNQIQHVKVLGGHKELRQGEQLHTTSKRGFSFPYYIIQPKMSPNLDKGTNLPYFEGISRRHCCLSLQYIHIPSPVRICSSLHISLHDFVVCPPNSVQSRHHNSCNETVKYSTSYSTTRGIVAMLQVTRGNGI